MCNSPSAFSKYAIGTLAAFSNSHQVAFTNSGMLNQYQSLLLHITNWQDINDYSLFFSEVIMYEVLANHLMKSTCCAC